jgi:hypothetical protein
MNQGISWIHPCIPDIPQHVSASGYHLQGVVGALEATQGISVLWAYTDYDRSSVANCRGMSFHNWPHGTDCNPHTSTIQILLE